MSKISGIIKQPITHEWETPQGFFDSLNEEFGFTLDAAANSMNHKVDRTDRDWQRVYTAMARARDAVMAGRMAA